MVAPKGHEPYEGCETGGRPKKYTDEFIENEALLFEEWMKKPDSVYFKEFAFERGYSQKCFSEWAEINQKFSETLTRVREWQEMRVAKGTLKNEFNAPFAKFFMGNVCGWVDRNETKISGDKENPLSCLLTGISGLTKELVDDKSDEE